MPVENNKETQGIKTIRRWIDEYADSKDSNELVRNYLNNVDDETILVFLRGRKHDVERAWSNLKRIAELKLVKYPEMFPKELSLALTALHQRPTAAVLKSRDSQGRRILVLDVARWDATQNSLMDLCIYGTFIMDNLMKDDDCVRNGLVIVHDGVALTLQHISQFTVKALLRLMNIFWHAYPIRYKAIYVVQTPYLLNCAINTAKFFCPQKLKDRLMVWPTDRGYEELHKAIQPSILPKSMGGELEFEEAIDPSLAVCF